MNWLRADGVSDDTAVLQARIEAMRDYEVLELPEGHILTTKPILDWRSGPRLVGQGWGGGTLGTGGTTLANGGLFLGSRLIFGARMGGGYADNGLANWTWVPSLVSGQGQALQIPAWDNNGGPVVNLSDGGRYITNLNGLRHFYFQTWWTPQDVSHLQVLLAGTDSPMDDATHGTLSVFGAQLSMDTSGHLSFHTQHQDGFKGLTSDAPLVQGVPVFLTFEWDGTTKRIFIGGRLAARQSVSTPMVQGFGDVVLFGGQTQGWNDVGVSSFGPTGTFDDVVLCDGFWHGTDASFTPPIRKFKGDMTDWPGTAFQVGMHFDFADTGPYGQFAVNQWDAARSYIRINGTRAQPQSTGPQIEDIAIFGAVSGACILMDGTPHWSMRNIHTEGGAYGIHARPNCYYGRLENHLSLNASQAQVRFDTASGIWDIDSVEWRGGRYGLAAFASGCGGELSSFDCNGQLQSGLLLDANGEPEYSNVLLRSGGFDNEGSQPAVNIGPAIVCSAVRNLRIQSTGLLRLDRSAGNQPALRVYNPPGTPETGLVIDSCSVGVNQLGVGEIVHYTHPPAAYPIFIGCQQWGGGTDAWVKFGEVAGTGVFIGNGGCTVGPAP